MEQFVASEDGDASEITLELAEDAAKRGRDMSPEAGRYLWEKDGQTAAIGWTEP